MSEEKRNENDELGCGFVFLLVILLVVVPFVMYTYGSSVTNKNKQARYQTAFSALSGATDQERFEIAAKYVFEDELIEARAKNKYPTVVIKKTGKAEHIRLLTNSDTLSFLQRIEEIRDAYGFDFKILYFEVRADLVDVYGNVSEELVLSFGITKESLDRINFENMSYSNIPKIAIGWYEHPVMK